MKVLCIHGVGHQEFNIGWEKAWRDTIARGLSAKPPGLSLDEARDIQFTDYDDLFAKEVNNLSAGEILRALALLGSGLFQRRALVLPNIADDMRWTAGMVAVWVAKGDVRQQAWQRFAARVAEVDPDLICAHSLGTLISYDAFRRRKNLIQGRTYLTFGCQLGNTFVRGQFGGRIEPFAEAAFWYDLYNAYDHVFTAPLDFGPFLTADNFQQVRTDFGTDWPWEPNHDAVSPDPVHAPDKGYLTNPQTSALVWPRIQPRQVAAPMTPALRAMVPKVAALPAAPRRRALLVGINAYPDPVNRLEGCLNDVFLISALLQECGFPAEDIRVVFDERATAAALRERLHWLLDGTGNDQRFFFYSGHGAQLPLYGVDGRIERIDACLAPYDFNWTRETAVTDDDLVNLYAQLPYGAHLMMVFDSCYSSGLTRGGARVRGLTPPDDIRHRMLRWDAAAQMWVPRELCVESGGAAVIGRPAGAATSGGGVADVGPRKAIRLLGRATALRTLPPERFAQVCKDLDHKGPFLPIVYEACDAEEFAAEYRHGVISHGAFTYALAATLRRTEAAGQTISFRGLEQQTAEILKRLHYQQHPVLDGPSSLLDHPIPWHEHDEKTGK